MGLQIIEYSPVLVILFRDLKGVFGFTIEPEVAVAYRSEPAFDRNLV